MEKTILYQRLNLINKLLEEVNSKEEYEFLLKEKEEILNTVKNDILQEKPKV